MAIIKFTDEHRKFFEEYCYGHSWKDIAEEFTLRFGIPITASKVGSYLKRHKLRTGRDGRFVKGRESTYAPPKTKEALERVQSTYFRKGMVPGNALPIGTERELDCGYIYVKVDNKVNVPKRENWKQKSVLLWEQKHGKLPDGYRVIFLDGNNKNFAEDNLMAVDGYTYALLNRNHLRTNCKELTELGVKVAELMKVRNENARRNNKGSKDRAREKTDNQKDTE